MADSDSGTSSMLVAIVAIVVIAIVAYFAIQMFNNNEGSNGIIPEQIDVNVDGGSGN